MKNLKAFTYFGVLVLMLLFSNSIASQTTYTISDPEALEDQTYVAGDVIILENGVYDSDERIDFIGNGTADSPITFRAESPGGVTFTGGLQMNIGGDYVVVDGFHWKGGYGASNFIQFRNGTDYANHSTIQNCAIDGLEISPDDKADDIADGSITKHRWIVLYGTYNTVINCSFMNKNSAGALILAEYAYNATPDEGVTNTRCDIVGHTISNNYFYKYAKMDSNLSNSGDSETIRIGTSEFQNVNSSATVSNNYFVEADGENEIITNKSKNNIYTNNTFRRSRGSLVLRHGSNATVDGNYFLGEDVDGTGGIRITDSDHTITNNYIQDCITVVSQAKWNNGITFIGGGDAAAVACTSNSVSNGYQKSQNINVSNNTIINTNAPLFFNEDKGSNDPTGTVSNNLIYFAANDSNLSDVISGDSGTAYNNLGTALTYSGNVYTGTELGVTNTGFTKETGITATANDEIFTISGNGSEGKGADMGAYTPATDDMVGYGIGACFLNNLGANITDGVCTIVVGEYIAISSLPTLTSVAGSYDVSVNANVSWTAVSNDSWISIDTNSGESGSVTVSITVTKNEVVSDRIGTVTFTQDAGGDDIVRTLNITQEGVELTELYNLINTGTGLDTDKVTVDSFSKEEVNGSTKFNYAKNTLDKDNGTVWAADDGAVLAGDYKGDGEYIIYDLGDTYDLDLIQFSTTNKSDPFGYQILVSTTGTNSGDFSMILPVSGELLLTATSTTDFNQYEVNSTARYIKLIGYGRFNSDGDTRKSAWNAIGEIEFYGDLSVQSGGDSDGDGVLDVNDNCPTTSNPNQEDFDGDGLGDVCDDDVDGDAILNNDDECSNTPAGEIVNTVGCSESQLDDDLDGVMNDVDNCPNTSNPNQEDFDGDDIGDVCDNDIDGDNILNDDDECPNTPVGEIVNAAGCSESQLDDDSDGVMNDVDNCPNTSNQNQQDVDGDGIGDVCDDDVDGDTILNDVDECPNTSAGEIVNAAGCSESQLDDDSDGVMNNVDNCPNTSNPNQEDLDGDDIGDVCDDDIDGDNIMNDVDICSDTPIGVSVDANGCILLAADNFEIETISETCPNKNNGQLIITANESRDYKLTINGNSQSFNSNVTIDNLSPGAYEICIEVVGITSPYCYVVEIEAGTTISGKSSLNNKQLQVEVTEGTLPYQVYVNGNLRFETYRNNFSLEVAHGDAVAVKTAVECEGVYAKNIKLFDELTVYPNPSEGLFSIAIPTNAKDVTVKVFNSISQMVLYKTFEVINSRVQLDLTNRPVGVYLVKVYSDKEYVFKAIKK